MYASPLRTVQVSTVTALRNAIAEQVFIALADPTRRSILAAETPLVAGDRIEVADGAYSLSDWVVVTRSGTSANPILR